MLGYKTGAGLRNKLPKKGCKRTLQLKTCNYDISRRKRLRAKRSSICDHGTMDAEPKSQVPTQMTHWACPGISGNARACPYVPTWVNFVIFGLILKISNATCISNGNLAFPDSDDPLGMPGHAHMYPVGLTLLFMGRF